MFDDARVFAWFVRHEGSVAHMYRDTAGKVTVGIGNMLPNAAAARRLAFVQRATMAAATPAEIGAAFDAVLAAPAAQPAARYRALTTLDLPPAAGAALFKLRLADFRADLVAAFPDFDAFPDAAQLGLLDMAYNLGSDGLLRKFPTFVKGVRARDWAVCARECRRTGIPDSRNRETRALFEEAAAAVTAAVAGPRALSTPRRRARRRPAGDSDPAPAPPLGA